jgi:hypothetical protein
MNITTTTTVQDHLYKSYDRPMAVIASNSNIDGYELAKQFAANGYDLIIAAINPSVVEEAEDLKEYGIDAVSFQVDLTTIAGVDQLYKKIVASGRPVEAIVINTGISEDLKNETILAAKILKDMKDHGAGHILFIAAEGQENVKQAFESIKEKAEGTDITVVNLQAGNTEINFLKKLH